MRAFRIAPLILAFVSAQNSQNPVIEEELERKILVSLYQYTDGASWAKNDNWNNPEMHFCDWFGIQCIDTQSSSRRRLQDAGKSIESIDLADNNLKGSVPISLLLLLPNIRSIRLNGNNVDYTKVADQEAAVLDQVLDLPISVRSSVQHLDVSYTSVKDITRLFRAGNGDTIITMPSLATLYASNSELRGLFPGFLVEFTKMERLALDHNSLTGTLPSTLGNLFRLKYLSLADNGLTGTLPTSVLSLVKLSYMILENNRFTGTIPIGLTSGEYTPLLEQLDLSNQRDESTPPGSRAGLSGHVPPFNTHKRLRRIDLGFNSLTGTIPSSLLSESDFAFFDFIILSSNLISGSVPSSVVNRVPFDGMFLDNNRITGLPTCPSSEYGCAALMCPPGTYEPRAGRQEEENRKCIDCSLNTKYWGQTYCRLEEGATSSAPVPVTVSPSRSPLSAPVTQEPTDISSATSDPTETPSIGVPLDPVNEKAILQDLYVAAGGSDWSNSDGWASPESRTSVCSWYGIVCVSDDVQSVKFVNLDNNNLLGQLPQSIYTLPNMTSLDLSQNGGLTVTFENIGEARSLETLDFSKTIIQSVDGILDAAPRLQGLHINDVSGFEGQRFPTEFYRLTNLRQLSMDYNDALGTLPTDIGNLSKLVVLSASNNALTGTIPPSIADMTDLATLRLSSNHLSGTLPEALENLVSLSVLDLSNQWSNGLDDDFSDSGKPGLHGHLPSFAKLSELRRLDLGVNSFSGSIPDDFLASVDTQNLFEFADIGDNFLTGTVPSGVARLQNLYMHDNLIEQIAQAVCDGVADELLPFGCDAVLCRPGTYNQLGRQAAEDKPCINCNQSVAAMFFGATECVEGLLVPSPAPNSSPTATIIPDSPERTALELIFSECSGGDWTSKGNWMDNTVPICFWDGIRCDQNNNVSEISLQSNLLNGTFPSNVVFGNISSLTSLVLDGNSVHFPFEGISQATNLKTLDLTQTELASVEGVGKSPSLENLYISSNNLKGTIPTEILALSSLKRLALAYNDLTGPITGSIAALVNLEFLSLHDNAFTGSIPSQLGQLTKLAFLLLESNDLSSSIPTQLNLLGSLRFISLAGQRGNGGAGLSGSIPSFATLTNLKKMDLSNNKLNGTIPSDFLDSVSIQAFEHVSLAQNSLTGELPNILSKFPVDQYDVTDNKISKLGDGLCSRDLGGPVEQYGCNAVLCSIGTWSPSGRQTNGNDACQSCVDNPYYGATLCDASGGSPPTLPPVTASDLSDEAILNILFDETLGTSWKRKDFWKESGISVCQWFGIRCDQDGNNRVEHVVLSTNNLVGTVPKEIFSLAYLKTLVLDSNNVRLYFDDIGLARRLEILDISATTVDDLAGIGAASQLRELHMKQIGLSGSFPAEIFKLTALEQIDFDFNSFKGPLTHGIGQLSNLKELSGEKNLLSGVLPDELSALTRLESLRLGRNSFAGNLPADALDQMTSLSYIDLSRQREHGGRGLSGPLPPLSNLKRITQVRLRENAFSGSIPYNFLKSIDSAEFEYADLSSNFLTGTIPASIARHGEIFLLDNMISGVPSAFCDSSRGLVYSQFGCDAFLCKPGSYNRQGRQESEDTPCEDCPEASYFGEVTCEPPAASPTANAPPVVEKEVLIKLYTSCGGENWDEQENWLSNDKSVCSWAGVQCLAGLDNTVEALELGANNLKGSPPTELYALPNLKSLSLYSNPLSSVSFEGIQYAKNLTELLLDATGISSIAGIEKAPSLKFLNIRFNSFQGTFPSELTQLTSLQILTMAYNALTGTLPSSIEYMTNLEALLVSHNQFSGNLHSVNFPSSIRRLDLSDNRLVGSIPESFLTLIPFSAELEVDLSSNHLEGSIPTALTRFVNLNIYLKDNKLTEINEQLCSMNDWNEGDVGRFGCNGILCPVGQFSPNGRHSSSGECQECASGRALHLGASNCDDSSGSSVENRVANILLATAWLTLLCLWNT
jgi:Leucine-rich repeat (LRR) protein